MCWDWCYICYLDRVIFPFSYLLHGQFQLKFNLILCCRFYNCGPLEVIVSLSNFSVFGWGGKFLKFSEIVNFFPWDRQRWAILKFLYPNCKKFKVLLMNSVFCQNNITISLNKTVNKLRLIQFQVILELSLIIFD